MCIASEEKKNDVSVNKQVDVFSKKKFCKNFNYISPFVSII